MAFADVSDYSERGYILEVDLSKSSFLLYFFIISYLLINLFTYLFFEIKVKQLYIFNCRLSTSFTR